jgi:crotonobetainyl-CoA:carnitine CoA-transferase CaiB-like acyl-CoA transferase
MNAYSSILLALRERDSSRVGQRIEVDLLSSLLSALVNQASGTLATGVSPGRLGNAHPSIAPYEMFHAADRELVIAVGNDRQFAALVGALDATGPAATGLADDARFATNPQRVANRDALHSAIEERLAGASAAEWVTRFSAVGVPAGLVNTIAEAIAFAESLGLDPVAETADGERRVRTIANPSHHPGVVYRTPPPRLGADTGADWLEKEARS